MPGDVVAWDTTSPSQVGSVERTTTAGQSTVVGIVSTNPGVVLGSTTSGYEIALAGRVPTKVTAAAGAISIGDALTSSNTTGHAQKATDQDPIVGYAMQNLASGTGVIEVFVNLDRGNPTNPQNGGGAGSFSSLNISGNTALGGNLTVAGNTTLTTLTVTNNATFQGDLVVAGTTSVQDIIVNGRIITAGDEPVVAGATSAGVGATVEIEGNDTAGTVTLTTGATGLASGEVVEVTFDQAYDTAPKIVVSAVNGSAAAANVYLDIDQVTDEEFMLVADFALAPNTTYIYNYIVLGLE